MVTVSCIAKFHAFALAEQLERKTLLDEFYTAFASQKNGLLKRFVHRVDKEVIPLDKIHTNSMIAFPAKLWQSRVFTWNGLFDKWVSKKIAKSKSRVFIGWSGMSYHSILAAKKKGMLTIVERGSSHIEVQNDILQEEYKKFGQPFSIPAQMMEKELMEYRAADFISVPSFFVRDSFLSKGVSAEKIFLNPYGASDYFLKHSEKSGNDQLHKLRIVYAGTISIRKGLIYLFEALARLDLPENSYEMWFIGHVDENMKETVMKYNRANWKWIGQVSHYDLPDYLRQCDIGIQPSLEEGLSMVIPQMMACGLAVVASANSGGANMIEDDLSGFIVPIRDPGIIASKIKCLSENPEKLAMMKTRAASAVQSGYTWNDYGERYSRFIHGLVPEFSS